MVICVHALMQNADDRDAIVRLSEIDDVLLDAASPIAGPYSRTAWRTLWSLSQLGAHGFDAIRVTQSLFQTPFQGCVIKDCVKVDLRPGTELVLSHTVLLYAP